jgi:DNA-binding YbaB/EbfC family protein
MFDPGSIDLQGLMAQAQAMQDQLEQAQAALAEKRVKGTAGGDLVEATVTGTGELVGLVIKPEACDPTDTETLADLIVAAVRDANHQAMALAQAAMPPMPELGL